LSIYLREFCPDHISKRIEGIAMQLHTLIQGIEEKCSAHAWFITLTLFTELFTFVYFFCPDHISPSIVVTAMKRHVLIGDIKENCSTDCS